MARTKAPTARHIERVLDQAQNATTTALSDVTRWLTAAGTSTPDELDEYKRRQQIQHLAANAAESYAAALWMLRRDYLSGHAKHYPVPPVPLHGGAPDAS